MASRTVMVWPRFSPSREAGCLDARYETLSLEFKLNFFFSIASKRRLRVINFVRDAG